MAEGHTKHRQKNDKTLTKHRQKRERMKTMSEFAESDNYYIILMPAEVDVIFFDSTYGWVTVNYHR